MTSCPTCAGSSPARSCSTPRSSSNCWCVPTRLAQLTPRQRAVLALVAEGRSNAAIAARLFISEKTVVNHLTSIYMTLGLELDDDSHRRVQAVLAFLSSRSS